jgi:hypothetical protein
MPASPSSQTDRYLVHHQGQVQGPFDVDFIEAMVMAGVYPFSVIVERPATSERLPFSKLVAAADSRPPPQKNDGSSRIQIQMAAPDPRLPPQQNPRSKKAKSETAIAWVVGVFAIFMVLWMITSATSPKKPTPSRVVASADRNNPSSINTPAENHIPSSAETKSSPVASNSTYAPTVNTPPADTMVYRDASGRTYRVSHSDYYRLSGMKSALLIKKSGMDAEETRLKSLATEVDRDEATLNRYNQYSVDSFNRKVSQVNAMNNRVQSLVNDYNQDVDAFNRDLQRVGTPIH